MLRPTRTNSKMTIDATVHVNTEKLQPAAERKRVKFSSKVKVTLIDPVVDLELKKILYYSRRDIWTFHKRLEIAIALRRQIKNVEELQIKMKENQSYLDHLKQKENSRSKRALNHGARLSALGSEISSKRKRRQSLV